MKNILLLLTASALTTSINAQPVITADEYLGDGTDTDTLSAIYIPESFNIGSAGPA